MDQPDVAIPAAGPAPGDGPAADGLGAGRTPHVLWRWLPLAAGVAATSALLLAAQTPVLDLVRYAAYAVLAVSLPGALLYRSLRRAPHTFVEDVAMGVALGLALELAAWAVFSPLDLRAVVWLWPAMVIWPVAPLPRL